MSKVNPLESFQKEIDDITEMYNKVAAIGDVEVLNNRFIPGKTPEQYVEDWKNGKATFIEDPDYSEYNVDLSISKVGDKDVSFAIVNYGFSHPIFIHGDLHSAVVGIRNDQDLREDVRNYFKKYFSDDNNTYMLLVMTEEDFLEKYAR